MSSITVITPWLNHPELADGYWDALEAGQPDDVIIVDNGSQPPLTWPGIRFNENRGFHAACNAGLHAAQTDAVLFLNNDIELQSPQWLEKIRGKLEPGKLVGELLQGWHAVVDGEWTQYLGGWCLAGMRDDLLAIGGWDETFDEPAYYGDNMLSLRAQQAGLELVGMGFIGLRHLTNRTTPDVAGAFHAAAAANRRRWKDAVRESRAVPA